MFDINKYTEIKEKIEKSNGKSQIIAISKNHPKESVTEAISKGVFIFGENRVIEAKNKFKEIKLQFPQVELHLTGPLQSNKVKEAISLFDVFHTLDREKIAREFSKHADKILNKKFFIQVNTGEEKSKSGVYPSDLKNFLEFCINEMSLNISGLMCIPPIDESPNDHFNFINDLAKKNKLEETSFGMSNDYEIALSFKPTYIRLGTILFGKRN